jgi:protein-S-isoprenylcysteine O-methyltransferase Ste14
MASENGPKQKLMIVARAILNGFLALVSFGLSLFLPAGTLGFRNAWLFLGIFVIGLVTVLVYFALTNSEYARKRLQANEQEKPQRIVMASLILAALAMLIVAGLDHRYRWSRVPVPLVVVAAVIMTASLVMVFIVMKQNAYASRVVEIQQHQKLIDTGTYSIVRHPMYLAFSILFCVSPIVLGSFFSLIPAACIPVLLTFRIRNEEQVLSKGLAGYDQYMKKVKYRLIPFVW